VSLSDIDERLLASVVETVTAAADKVRAQFSSVSRPSGLEDIVSRIRANDQLSMGILREGLHAARPAATIVEDEMGTGALPDGEWWIVDPVEGAINQIHGMSDWCVTAALIRDNLPIVTAVHLPLAGETYTAVRGGGAFLNGERLKVSAKPDLRGAMVGTGQAMPGESGEIHRLIGESVTLMLRNALTVRVSVPATLQLIQVAAGRMDAFWQFSQVRSGLVSGALLVREAGGSTTDVDGNPWTFESPNFLAAPAQFATPMAALLSPLVRSNASKPWQIGTST
jgi:myo-inositol-1(or 4)-monophosphatase